MSSPQRFARRTPQRQDTLLGDQHNWHRNLVCFSRLVACLSALHALCNLCNLIGQVLELHRLDNAIKSTSGHPSTVVGFWPVFLRNFTHSSNHALMINSVTRGLANTPCFKGNPTNSWSVSSSCMLRVSCGTSFHSCNQAFRHVDYLFLTTFSATMFAVYLLSDPNGPPTAFLLFRVSLPGPTGVPSDAQARWHRGQSANPYLLHRCCTAEPVLTHATKQFLKYFLKKKKNRETWNTRKKFQNTLRNKKLKQTLGKEPLKKTCKHEKKKKTWKKQTCKNNLTKQTSNEKIEKHEKIEKQDEKPRKT